MLSSRLFAGSDLIWSSQQFSMAGGKTLNLKKRKQSLDRWGRGWRENSTLSYLSSKALCFPLTGVSPPQPHWHLESGQTSLGGCPVHGKMVSSFPGPMRCQWHPAQLWQPTVSPDIAEGALGNNTVPLRTTAPNLGAELTQSGDAWKPMHLPWGNAIGDQTLPFSRASVSFFESFPPDTRDLSNPVNGLS